ncbi:hypothetical protein B0H10DRAFT_1939198 [Mycena sp. CBHHK59/15]|nr:hypothetical protein B0H10DRAFT_1939198 [Mycena sp. CBHHK59/15]
MAHALLLLDPAAVCQLWVPATQLPGLLDPCTGAAPLRVPLGSTICVFWDPATRIMRCGIQRPTPHRLWAAGSYTARAAVAGPSHPPHLLLLLDPATHIVLDPPIHAMWSVGYGILQPTVLVSYWYHTICRGAVLSVMQCLNCALKESPQTHLKRCACGLFYCVDRDGQTFVVRHISERLRKHLDRNVGLYSKAGLAMLHEEYPAQALTSIVGEYGFLTKLVVEDSDIGHTFATMRAEHSSTGQPNLYILCQAHYSTDGYAGVVNVYKHIVFPTDDPLPTTTAIQALTQVMPKIHSSGNTKTQGGNGGYNPPGFHGNNLPEAHLAAGQLDVFLKILPHDLWSFD